VPIPIPLPFPGVGGPRAPNPDVPDVPDGGEEDGGDIPDEPRRPGGPEIDDYECRPPDKEQAEPIRLAPMVTGFLSNADHTRTFVDPLFEPSTRAFMRLLVYREFNMPARKKFTDSKKFYYTVVLAKKTVYLKSVVMESDTDGPVIISCRNVVTGDEQHRHVFVNPGYNTVPLDFVLKAVRFVDTPQATDGVERTLAAKAQIAYSYSSYEFRFEDVDPRRKCVRFTHCSYRALAGLNQLQNDIVADTVRDYVDTDELEFRYGYTVDRTDTSFSFSQAGENAVQRIYGFFHFQYYTAKPGLTNEQIPRNPINYEITTRGAITEKGQTEAPTPPEVTRYSKEFRNLTYDPAKQVTETVSETPAGGGEPETFDVTYSPSNEEFFSKFAGYLVGQPISVRSACLFKSASISYPGETNSVATLYLTEDRQDAPIIAQTRITRLTNEEDTSKRRVKPDLFIPYSGKDGEPQRFVVWYEMPPDDQPSAAPAFVGSKYVNNYSTDHQYRMGGTEDDPVRVRFGNDKDRDMLYRRASMQEDYTEEIDTWGPLFEWTLVIPDPATGTYRGESLASSTLFDKKDREGLLPLRANCLHVTAPPDRGGEGVTDPRELIPALTVVPGGAVGVGGCQFPRDVDAGYKMEVGGNLRAEGLEVDQMNGFLGPAIQRVLYDIVNRNNELILAPLMEELSGEMGSRPRNADVLREVYDAVNRNNELILAPVLEELSGEVENRPKNRDVLRGVYDVVNRNNELILAPVLEKLSGEVENRPKNRDILRGVYDVVNRNNELVLAPILERIIRDVRVKPGNGVVLRQVYEAVNHNNELLLAPLLKRLYGEIEHRTDRREIFRGVYEAINRNNELVLSPALNRLYDFIMDLERRMYLLLNQALETASVDLDMSLREGYEPRSSAAFFSS